MKLLILILMLIMLSVMTSTKINNSKETVMERVRALETENKELKRRLTVVEDNFGVLMGEEQ